jgi:glycosyltransferase involved in cell wall biosynthesis
MSSFQTKIKKIPSWIISVVATRAPLPIKKPLRSVYRYFRDYRIRNVVDQNQKELKNLIPQEGDPRPVIVFAPSLDWNTQLFQRPQQLALALAREGAVVFYIQPQADPKAPSFFEYCDRLYLCNVNIDAFQILETPYVYTLTWNSGYVSRFKAPQVIYDYVDDVNVFYGNHEEIVANHKQMTQEAQFVLATAVKLYEEVASLRQDVILSPNGVDLNHFAMNGQPVVPSDDLSLILERKQPIIGYYGALARWFDYELVKQLSALRPDYSFVLIGPDYDGTLKPAGLLDIPNVFWLGVKNYQDLPAYLHFFDVATIPFLVNDITHAVSPLKLFEYMAGGKPIVVTPMRETMRYPGILIGRTPEEFASQLDKALELRNDPDYISAIRNVALQNTWDTRARDLIDRIQAASAKQDEARSVE